VRPLQPRARPAALLHVGVLRAGALLGRQLRAQPRGAPRPRVQGVLSQRAWLGVLAVCVCAQPRTRLYQM